MRNFNNSDIGEVCAMISRIFQEDKDLMTDLTFEVQEYMLSMGIVDDYDMGDEVSIEGTPQNTAWEDDVMTRADELIKRALDKIERL